MYTMQLQVLCNILRGSILLGHHILTVNKTTEVKIHLKKKWRVVIDSNLWLGNCKMAQHMYVQTACSWHMCLNCCRLIVMSYESVVVGW